MLTITMVYPMLINTEDNRLKVSYKQNINTNKFKSNNKLYEYKEINIPVELLNYWKSILNDEIKNIAYIVSSHDGLMTAFITPVTVDAEDVNLLDMDISLLHNVPEVVKPFRVILLKVRSRGNVNSKKYFIRLNKKEVRTGSKGYVNFFVDPYRDDPILKTKGLVTLDGVIVL